MTSVVAVGAYGAYRLYEKKRELENLIESLGLDQLLGDSSSGESSSSRQSREQRVREHFAATQREADRLLHEALPRLQEQVAQLLDTDGFKERMRSDRLLADLSSWHELKVLVISRLLTTQYALVLTALTIRMRLNIVSRHYLVEVEAAASGEHAIDGALSKVTKRRFLSAEHLLSEGLLPLEKAVTACVRAHLAGELTSATTQETLVATVTGDAAVATLAPMRAELETGLMAREAVGYEPLATPADVAAANGRNGSHTGNSKEGDGAETEANGARSNGNSGHGSGNGGGANGSAESDPSSRDSVLRSFLLEELLSFGRVAEGDQLSDLLDEMRDILSSPVFRNTLDELVQSSFELASEQLGRAFLTPDGASTRGIPRAKVLAQYNKLAVSTLSSPEPYAARLLQVPSLEELCWLVYAGE